MNHHTLIAVLALLPLVAYGLRMERVSQRHHTNWGTPPVSASSPLADKGIYYLFPAECPTSTGACCPNNCGAAQGRGICLDMTVDSQICDVAAVDALGWVWTNFAQTCKCHPHFRGAACEKCNYGWSGPNCDQRARPVIRRDFATLNTTEQQRVIQAFTQIRNTPSEYAPLNLSSWNYFASMHYWATTAPFNSIPGSKTNPKYAHSGQGFPTWHRRYMRDMELALQRALGDDTFGMPYWNWTVTAQRITDLGLQGAIAAEPLLTAFGGSGQVVGNCYFVNTSVPYQGNCHVTTGPFANWPTYDPTEQYTGVNWCPFGNLTRTLGLLPSTLPNSSHVEFLMAQATYAIAPFDSTRPLAATPLDSTTPAYQNTFEQSLEGNDPEPSQKLADGQSMHDSVHDWCGGSMSWLLTAANDPLFYMHHTFIDKLLETWIRAYTPERALAQMGAAIDSPVGHGRDECQAPFYPLTRHSYWMNYSDEFGYAYDFVPPVTKAQTTGTSTVMINNVKGGISDVTAGAAIFYACMGALVALLGVLIVYQYKQRSTGFGGIGKEGSTHRSGTVAPSNSGGDQPSNVAVVAGTGGTELAAR